MFLVFGILAALWERERSGKGQVVDAAIIDGVASLMTMFTGLTPSGRISLEREGNLLGGAAPFYRCYLCSDGKEMSVGPLEPQFFALMLDKLRLAHLVALQHAEDRWGELAGALAATFATQPQHYWAELFAGTDACAAPVLEAKDAPHHPHNIARATFVQRDGLFEAAPAPRFSRTAAAIRPAVDAEDMLANWCR